MGQGAVKNPGKLPTLFMDGPFYKNTFNLCKQDNVGTCLYIGRADNYL